MKKLFVSLFAALAVFVPAVFGMSGFTDLNDDTDYRDAILWTVDQGITSGYGNGMWGPDECVRRAELMKMVMGSRPGFMPQDVDEGKNSFSDVRSTDWFYLYVMSSRDAGYISGYSDGTFRPNVCVNRAEAMKIAVNVLVGGGNLDSSGGPVMYDDKIVADISIGDWFGPYARLLFKNRLVGTNHTRAAGLIAGTTTINFFPGESMTRKEVAEMLYRINVYNAARE